MSIDLSLYLSASVCFADIISPNLTIEGSILCSRASSDVRFIYSWYLIMFTFVSDILENSSCSVFLTLFISPNLISLGFHSILLVISMCRHVSNSFSVGTLVLKWTFVPFVVSGMNSSELALIPTSLSLSKGLSFTSRPKDRH